MEWMIIVISTLLWDATVQGYGLQSKLNYGYLESLGSNEEQGDDQSQKDFVCH